MCVGLVSYLNIYDWLSVCLVRTQATKHQIEIYRQWDSIENDWLILNLFCGMIIICFWTAQFKG